VEVLEVVVIIVAAAEEEEVIVVVLLWQYFPVNIFTHSSLLISQVFVKLTHSVV